MCVGDPSEAVNTVAGLENNERTEPTVPTNPLTDIGNHVILVFGDLGTGDHLRSLLASRSEERTHWRQLRWLVYVMGLFHLKMACVDAIWRLFIRPVNTRKGENSLINLIGRIRERETGKFESKPTFRQMHDATQHIGVGTRLEAWRLLARTRGYSSLEAFAAARPTFTQLVEYSEILASTYVAGRTFHAERRKPDQERDKHHENMLQMQKIFLLYEELTYAMNTGDIGRLETVFIPWSAIFFACGKHRYANELLRYLKNVYFVYPEGLRRAVRYNILANPTGKSDGFRGIDWMLEHQNLYIKRIYCGSGSNRTLDHIISQSPLIEVYKETRREFEEMFDINHNGTQHSKANMERTFLRLTTYMEQYGTVERIAGRGSTFALGDLVGSGMNQIYAKFKQGIDTDTVAPTAVVEGEDLEQDAEANTGDNEDDWGDLIGLFGDDLGDDEEEVEGVADLEV
ncbi:hypothetical protein BDN72DRAFT_780820 [Pluteus cervinus]|uniref:Uncharacterized protein n=1 Tax=Pluteus cervinus TaxID=181527 RepID=A0ACD3A259_9AGAR|nr:hypothetical protein BDN72DRAFT_780820 [Pluteus cervinus]